MPRIMPLFNECYDTDLRSSKGERGGRRGGGAESAVAGGTSLIRA